MNTRLTMACSGLIVGAIMLGVQGTCLAETASAIDDSNPYSVISGRNVFHLNPTPLPPAADKGPPPVLPQVYLSGFARTGDKLKVLLVVKTNNSDLHGQEMTCYLSLGEGDKQGVIEVVKADADSETVDIINSGTAVSLSIKDNGLEHVAAAADADRKPPVRNPRILRGDNGMTPAMEMRAARISEDAARAEQANAGGTATPLP